MSSKYKCIIFGCHGVLVDSEFIAARVLKGMAQDYGLELSAPFLVEEFSGKFLNESIEYIEGQIGTRLPDTFEKEFRKKSFDAFKRELKPIEGVKEVLATIDTPYCIASSSPMNKITHNLEITGLLHFFNKETIFSAYDITLWKPHPGIFLHAALRMGFVPSECAVVENSITGIQAGLLAGFDVFALSNDKNRATFQKEGAITFREMKDLKALLYNLD